jgi:hypothetical protein
MFMRVVSPRNYNHSFRASRRKYDFEISLVKLFLGIVSAKAKKQPVQCVIGVLILQRRHMKK